MGIAKFLKSGKIILNSSQQFIFIEGDEKKTLKYSEIKPSDWGKVYEKFVGQFYEEKGCSVVYFGLEKGFNDRGIDLIIEDEKSINFLQCKYVKGYINKRQLDWVLYKASKKLFEEYKVNQKRIKFTLVVNSFEENFSRTKPNNLKLNYSNIEYVKYPWLQYFLDHNYIQDKVKLQAEEIEMKK